jgi:hypothetical protein
MSTVLQNAAFGKNPERWPLPPATSPHELWLRAVIAGGQGRYGSALTDLARIVGLQHGGSVVSLAHSTRASFLRQLGWHTHARTWDGRALASAESDVEASADAFVGLAADALGMGRFAASARALDRARELLAGQAPARLPVRLAWVSSELAMVRGDGETAVEHAHRAVDLAAGLGSVRHAVKSDVVLAAALCSAGDVERSRRVADDALSVCERHGMIPLRWALACLLAVIGSAAHSAQDVIAIRDESADTVRSRGGVWALR